MDHRSQELGEMDRLDYMSLGIILSCKSSYLS